MKCFASLLFALAAAVAVQASNSNLAKRGILEDRQTCPSGYVAKCPVRPCVPPGSTCCDELGHYAPPGYQCCRNNRIVPSGGKCPSGTELPETPVAPASSTITPAPAPPTIIEGSTSTTAYTYNYSTWYYTYSWTYFYYYYYYTYIAEYYSTATSSYETTFYTTFSFSGTDEAAASSQFVSYTATLTFFTPSQTETPISGSAGPASPTATVAANGTASSSPPPAQFTGGATPALGQVGILLGSAFLKVVAAAAVLL